MAKNGGIVAKETTPIPVDIQGYLERVSFDVTRTNTYDAVLGLLWLEKHNPTINYKKRTMSFNGYGCKPKKNIDIEKVLMRAINAYYRQDPEQVYLAMVTVKGDELFFTVL
jgi:hypothetical protein